MGLRLPQIRRGVGTCSDPPLTAQTAILEERMKTRQVEYETGLERLSRQISEHEARLAARDTALILWIVGVAIALGASMLSVMRL